MTTNKEKDYNPIDYCFPITANPLISLLILSVDYSSEKIIVIKIIISVSDKHYQSNCKLS